MYSTVDLDASCAIVDDSCVGYKTSSAYAPPEAIYVDKQNATACVRSIKPANLDETSTLPYELLNAHPSFDVWSLGCILYQMCTDDVGPLFQSGQDDCLTDKMTEEDNLFALADWESEYKDKKLSRITNGLARNLLGQILQKDPQKRPKLSRVLAHPFLSNKKVDRMVGERAKWDVFISYRVDSEMDFAEKLYNALTAQGFKVFWDKVCLETGVNWEEGFCAGFVSSRAYVPLLSRKGINNPDREWQNFSKLTADSRCDNVFLEQRMAVELHELGLIESMFPIFIADLDISTNEYGKYFASGCHPVLPDIQVGEVEKKLREHMENQALGTPLKPNNTVKDVVNAITACQGAFIEGPAKETFKEAIEKIVVMLTTKKGLTVDNNASEILASSTTPKGSLHQLQTLLTAEQDRTMTLRNIIHAATHVLDLSSHVSGDKDALIIHVKQLLEEESREARTPAISHSRSVHADEERISYPANDDEKRISYSDLEKQLKAERNLKAIAERELKEFMEGKKRKAEVDYRDLDEYSLFHIRDASAKVKYLSEKLFTPAELAEHNYEYWFYMVFEAKAPFDAELDKKKADMSGYATEKDSTPDYQAAYTLLCDRVESYVRNDNRLAYKPNNQGLVAVKNARGVDMRERIRSLVLWHGLYMTSEDRSTHQSATCLVFKATDVRTGDSVALKLMRRKDQYKREIEQRRRLNAVAGAVNTASEYVVLEVDTKEGKPETGDEEALWPEASYTTYNQALEQANKQANETTVPAIDDGQEQHQGKASAATSVFVSKEFAEKYYLIVMPFAAMNLFSAFKSELWAGKNMSEVRHVFIHLVTCVQYMHGKGVLHADLKTMNIIRSDGQWKLIDLDAASEIGKEPVGHKSSSAYVPPEAIYLNDEVDGLRKELALAKTEFQTLSNGDNIDLTTQWEKKKALDQKVDDLSKRLAEAEACASGDGSRPCVRSVEAVNKGEASYELLMAHPSFDVWSLGCILYQMCNADVKPLFQGGREDNLVADLTDEDNLFALAEWSKELKEKKLARVVDKMARNLLSQMLHKDPLQRPTLARVLAHPFLSEKPVNRLVGDKAKYDVFLSYRVASDSTHVCKLYDLLTAPPYNLSVYRDVNCLKPGVDWEQGFIQGVVSSRAFVPLLSRDAINNPTEGKPNFSKLTAESPVDNVLLEYRMAVELQGLGLIEYVYPIFIGDLDETTQEYSNYFGSSCHPSLPDVTVKSVEEKLRHHMESQALGTPLVPDRTVKSVVGAVTTCQGAFLLGSGSLNQFFEIIAATIVEMLKDTPPLMRKTSTMVMTPRGGMTIQKTLYDALQRKLETALSTLNNGELDNVEDLKTRLQALLQR